MDKHGVLLLSHAIMACGLFVLGGNNFRGNYSMYQLNPRRFLPDSSLYSPSTLSKVAARDVNSLVNSGRCLSQSLSSHVGGAEVSRMCSDERMHDGARSLPIRCVAHDVEWPGVPVSSNATDDTTRRCSSSISLGKHAS